MPDNATDNRANMAGEFGDNFHMPAEWSPHAACWMGWPCRAEVFGDCYEARAAFTEIARRIAAFEPVMMIARPQDAAAARQQLGDCATVLAWQIDDSWLRDSGPTFVQNTAGEIAGIDWRFNAWGQKYTPFDNDNALPARILQHIGVPRLCAPLIMEGGSFCTDGEGTLLTTEQCLLNPNRNPSMSRAQVESYLCDYLGVQKIIWLAGDSRDTETDGHVDEVACFVAPGVVLAMESTDDKDLCENIRRLREATDARGRRLKVLTLPRPEVRHNGTVLLASYINFYIANGGIIMPSFGVRHDVAAKSLLTRIFPQHTISQVAAQVIARGGGGIHCITQQQPRAIAHVRR